MAAELFQQHVFDADAKTVLDFIFSNAWRIEGGSSAASATTQSLRSRLREVWAWRPDYAYGAILAEVSGPRGLGASIYNVEVADAQLVYVRRGRERWRPLTYAPPDFVAKIDEKFPDRAKGADGLLARAEYGAMIALKPQEAGECPAWLYVETDPARWKYKEMDAGAAMQKGQEFIGEVWRSIVDGWLRRNRGGPR